MTAITPRLDQNIINQLRASLIRGAGIYWIFTVILWFVVKSTGEENCKKKTRNRKIVNIFILDVVKENVYNSNSFGAGATQTQGH